MIGEQLAGALPLYPTNPPYLSSRCLEFRQRPTRQNYYMMF
jgi:hypothetical protein